MDIDVTFPGGKRVDARIGELVIRTDQSVAHGGQGSAPEPFALFLASLGTCAGLYVVGFCQARGIPTDDLRVTLRTTEDDKGHLVHVALEVHVPPGFPAQYRDAVARAASACKVKKTLANPPTFDVLTVVDPAATVSV
jgi:ribosomal protein S12 methylthiotransferase accessory factor